ncbi:malto-oligosyltrehalose trehalohydrolase, partial [Clostridium perfringens]|nr:malto-oligosyltrehalose trehalohydrolase [Clostridium perfringens]
MNKKIILHLLAPEEKFVDLQKDSNDYFSCELNNIKPGTKYLYQLDDGEFPDPASNYQPDGVHGASQVIDHKEYLWNDK